MRMARRAQISTEVLILVGLMLALLVPLLIYSYNRAEIARGDLSVQKAEFAAERLAAVSNSVGYLGGATKMIEEIEMPQHMKRVYVNNHDIVIEVYSSGGVKQIVKTTDFELESPHGFGLENITAGGTYFIEASTNELPTAAQKVRRMLK